MDKAIKHTCTERVWHARWRSGCSNTAKHDPDENGVPTKCGVHSKAAQAKRDAKSAERRQAWQAEWDRDRAIADAKSKIIPALRQIAAGHNDPRGLATEVLAALDAASGGKHDDGDI
jgi:hypothetical protein